MIPFASRSTARWAALALLAALICPPAFAEAPLTLESAIARASAENPGLQAAARAIEAAQARERQAVAWPNPNLSLIVDQVALNNPGGGNYMAGVTQPLLPGGQREAKAALALAETELAQLAYETARLDLSARVREAYVQLLYAQDARVQADQEARAGRELSEATRARFSAGEVARVESLRAQVEASRLDRARSAAQGREAQARGRLNVLLGRPAQSPLAVADLPLPAPHAEGALARHVSQALAHRPELRQATVQIAREALSRRVAATGLWTGTEVMVLAGAVAGAPGFSSSLSVPIPIYRQEGELAEADANRARAEAERRALANSVTLEVEEAYRDATSAAEQLAAFQTAYMPEANRLAANARARFKAGEGSGVEVIEAARALHETRAAYAEAVRDYRLAELSLERAVAASAPLHPNQELP